MSFIPSLSKGDLVADAWGIQKVSVPFSLFHGMFTYDIPETMWFMYENGTQVYTSTNIISSSGVAVVTSDVTKTSVLLESRSCPRYQPNRGQLFSTALWCPSKTAAGVRDFGLFTTENGVFFRLKANGKLYAVLRRNSVEVLEEEINTSILTGFDVQKNNIYDIQFQWRSAGNYFFYIGDPGTGASTLVHTFNLLGTLTTASIENPSLPVAFKSTYTSAGVSIYVGCADVTSENGTQDTLQYKSAYAGSITTTIDTPVIVLYNPLTISGKTNTRDVFLVRVTLTNSKKAVFTVWKTRDLTGITGATFKTIQGSFVQCDSVAMDATAVKATSVTLAKLDRLSIVPVEIAVPREVNTPLPERIELSLVRGDYYVITCTSASGSADVLIEWGEKI